MKILLILASIGAIFLIGFLVFGILAIQDKYEPEPIHKEIQIVESENESVNNTKLILFLENPLDLQSFKKLKDIDYTTTGVSNGMNYHFHPKISDSIFYTYNYPSKNFTDSKRIDQVVVFKHGKNKHTYDDETEILIELRVFNKDSDLGKANLVGLSKTELESEFGTDYLTLKNGLAYSNKNKVLIIGLTDSIVNSFNYIRLNTEKIDNDLIGQIIKSKTIYNTGNHCTSP
ncbi:hypothetical protein [Mariniflexile rhizosphaerae]|uniref:hypothetical protein n=1 Tax=unclassified Mariniflexile TaxID=2643887 RepID=UPI0013C2B9D6|nr:hypothetical protein [Mariniflexile sp. TRM1-10]